MTDTASPPRGRFCLTCADWDVRKKRDRTLADAVAYCLRPSARAIHQVVSGSCACDHWRPLDPESDTTVSV
ncbi:MAG TPA: hypothetical protein PKK84_06860 [Armatimonadota bacterium]|nr:hypothetical protein [Armatimonadota bacterium]